MTIRHLRIFLAVCEELNMTRAAKKMYMSQPSVSQAIQELEISYDIKLFERLGKKLHLTTSGEKLLTYARYIVHSYDELNKEMKIEKNFSSIRIGTTLTIGETLLVPLIKTFKKMYPNIFVYSIVGNTQMIEQKILHDQIDIALVEGMVKSDDLVIKPIIKDELGVILSPHNRLNMKPSLCINDLLACSIIMREKGSGTRERFESEMIKRGLGFKIISEYNNFSLIKKAVQEDLGISIISKRVVEQEIKQNELVWKPIKDLSLVRDFLLIHHKNKYLSHSIQLMLDLINHKY